MQVYSVEVVKQATTQLREPFTLPLTPDEEYWAGFIHADGSISAERGVTRFAQKDLEPVKALHQFLDLKTKIYFSSRFSNFGLNEMHSISVSAITANLQALGVKGQPVPSLYSSRHFWRGMIDGDGTVVLPSHRYPRVILCGAYDDIWEFSHWCARLFGYQGPKPYKQKTGVWYAGLGSGKAMLLGLHLYQDAFSAVPRKRDVALSFKNLPINHRANLIGEVA